MLEIIFIQSITRVICQRNNVYHLKKNISLALFLAVLESIRLFLDVEKRILSKSYILY